jgi:hypothetical protein
LVVMNGTEQNGIKIIAKWKYANATNLVI